MDFVTVTALHPCETRPDLYPPSVSLIPETQTYDWGMAFEGVTRDPRFSESPGCVQHGVEDIGNILQTDPMGFDGIGGICDGSTIASLVAARFHQNPVSRSTSTCAADRGKCFPSAFKVTR